METKNLALTNDATASITMDGFIVKAYTWSGDTEPAVLTDYEMMTFTPLVT